METQTLSLLFVLLQMEALMSQVDAMLTGVLPGREICRPHIQQMPVPYGMSGLEGNCLSLILLKTYLTNFT